MYKEFEELEEAILETGERYFSNIIDFLITGDLNNSDALQSKMAELSENHDSIILAIKERIKKEINYLENLNTEDQIRDWIRDVNSKINNSISVIFFEKPILLKDLLIKIYKNDIDKISSNIVHALENLLYEIQSKKNDIFYKASIHIIRPILTELNNSTLSIVKSFITLKVNEISLSDLHEEFLILFNDVLARKYIEQESKISELQERLTKSQKANIADQINIIANIANKEHKTFFWVNLFFAIVATISNFILTIEAITLKPFFITFSKYKLDDLNDLIVFIIQRTPIIIIFFITIRRYFNAYNRYIYFTHLGTVLNAMIEYGNGDYAKEEIKKEFIKNGMAALTRNPFEALSGKKHFSLKDLKEISEIKKNLG